MLANIKAHMRPAGDGKGGTYFGATGCGKTYTMLFLSRLIAQRDNEAFNNPTIIILADREDLDTQTSELFVTATKYLHESDVRSCLLYTSPLEIGRRFERRNFEKS